LNRPLELTGNGRLMTLRDFRLPSRSWWEPRFSGLLRSEWWQFITDVSGQTIGPIFRGSI